MMDFDCQDKTDEEIVQLSLRDSRYFYYLMKRYEDKLQRYIRRISGFCQEEVEDILQEVFIKVFRYLNDFDASQKFSTWVYAIARNQTISSHRRLKARPEGYRADLDDYAWNNLAADFNLEQEVNRQLNEKLIIQVLGRLDKKNRDILVLKYLEEKDYKEMAEIIKKPIGTVATMLFRAKKKFREEWERQLTINN